MKKLLVFLSLLLPVAVSAQLQLPYPIKLVVAKPLDWFYYKNSGVPYANAAEVTAQVPSAARYKGQTFNVAGIEYWFKDGITNGDLMSKGLVQGANTLTQDLNFDGAFDVTWGGTTPIGSFRIEQDGGIFGLQETRFLFDQAQFAGYSADDAGIQIGAGYGGPPDFPYVTISSSTPYRNEITLGSLYSEGITLLTGTTSAPTQRLHISNAGNMVFGTAAAATGDEYHYAGDANGFKVFGYFSNSLISLKENSHSASSFGTILLKAGDIPNNKLINVSLIGSFATPGASGFRVFTSQSSGAVAVDRLTVDDNGVIKFNPSVAAAVGQVPTATNVDGTWTWQTPSGGGGTLVPTAVKTANYTAAVSDFVPCDITTTGSFTVTLPTAPADNTEIGIKIIKFTAARTITIAVGGSDVFNVAAGSTSLTLSRLFQTVKLHYKSSSAIWYVYSTDPAAATATTGTSDIAPATNAFVQQEILANLEPIPIRVVVGGLERTSLTAYGLIVGGTTTTSATQSVAAGTALQVLQSGGASAIPAWSTATFPATAGTSGNVMTSNGTNWSSAAPAIRLDQITGATTTATVNHAANAIEWQWNTLAGATGLKFSSTSTAAGSNLQKIIEVAQSGANGTSAQSTYSIYASNTHTGTTSVNYGGYFNASGGSTNIGLNVPAGQVRIGAVGINNIAGVGASQVGYLEVSDSGTPAITIGRTTSSYMTMFQSAGTFFIRNNTGTDAWNLTVANNNMYWVTTAQSTTHSDFAWYTGAHTGGVVTGYTFQPSAYTGLTASTESTDVLFALNRTVQFATGALATQRAVVISAPTYSFVGASTITDAVTLDISPPVAGTNATITNPWALRANGYVRLGASNASGSVNITGNVVGIGGDGLVGVSNVSIYDGTLAVTNISGFSFASIAGDPRVNNANGVNYSVGGIIFDDFSDSNNVTTTETDLYTRTTAASTLSTNGDKIFARYAGTFNDVTATTTLKVYFGGTSIANTGALTVSATGGWEANVLIIRTGATTVRATVSISTPGASTALYTTETDVTGLTLSSTNILKITGQAGGAGGGSSDITAKLSVVSFFPAAP